MQKKSYKQAIFLEYFAKYVKSDDSNLQTKFGEHITSNIFKIIKF